MAEFCAQCVRDTLDGRPEMNDFGGLTTPTDWAEGVAAIVLCEGCGPIQVDPDGFCVSDDCLRKGHK